MSRGVKRKCRCGTTFSSHGHYACNKCRKGKAPVARKCPACGQPFGRKQAKCRHCGASVTAMNPPWWGRHLEWLGERARLQLELDVNPDVALNLD